MKREEGHIITQIVPGSIAEELELAPGDRVLAVNGEAIEDVFDYHFLIQDEQVTLTVLTQDQEEWDYEIEKAQGEDLGIVFENSLMDEYRRCTNNCIFCFIDQMPPGMRETLYFKDDDSRLSFLQGNYVTLTNMKEADIRRIIRFHLAPINISVHTTNPELRVKMLHNRFAGEALKNLKVLSDAGIEMNAQIVLCRGINDGAELDRTIGDLADLIPQMQSLSVVPVGLTKFRKGLYPLEPFDGPSCAAVIDQVEAWQKKIYEKHGIHFVQASDEFYLQAGRQLPEEERYDGYLQLENGVGMVRLFLTEAREALREITESEEEAHLSFATGRLVAPVLEQVLAEVKEKRPHLDAKIWPIRNDFFGELITVAGLVTGQDLIAQLKGKDLGTRLFLPQTMFRSGEEVLLDDITRAEVEEALGVPVTILPSGGADFVKALCGTGSGKRTRLLYQGYEREPLSEIERAVKDRNGEES